MSATLTLDPGGSNERILDDEVIDARGTKIHTGVGDWEATVRYAPELADRRGETIHLADPATGYFFRGELLQTIDEESADDARTMLWGKGVAIELERDGNEHTVTNTLIHDAIDAYWADETPFTATVTDQTAEETTTDTQAQEANTTAEFNAIAPSFADTEPLTVTNDTVTTLATGDAQDESENTDEVDTLPKTGNEYNDGSYRTFVDNTVGEGYIEFQFSFDYDIPAENVDIRVRNEYGSNTSDIDFLWNGVVFDRAVGTSNIFLGWDNISEGVNGGAGWGYQDRIGADLEAGRTYTLRIESVDAGTEDDYIIDCVAVHDDRWNYDYPNPDAGTLGGGILDGPQEYPDSIEVEFNTAATTWNVTDATLTTTWDDTSGNQRIQLQLPPNGNWLGASNSTTTTQSFGSDVGTAVRGRARFDRHGSGGSSIPATGFQGQTLQSWEITFDGNDVPVYTDVTLEGSDRDILQQMHEDGRMRYTIPHDADSLTVESYPTGGITKPQPDWTVISTSRTNDLGGNYANHVTVRGAKDSDGNRIKTTVSDSAAISDFGQIHYEERIPDADTAVKVQRAARQILKERLRESEVTAERELVSIDIQPGYSYPIDASDGTTTDVPSEEVEYRLASGDVTGLIRFDVRATELQERLNSVDSGLTRTQLSF